MIATNLVHTSIVMICMGFLGHCVRYLRLVTWVGCMGEVSGYLGILDE